MLAVQFQSVNKPIVRDTRDTWELRKDLQKEKELQEKLIQEIRFNEKKISEYETKKEKSKGEILKETVEELKIKAGLTEFTGPGVKISIEPIHTLGPNEGNVTSDLLVRMLNEMNRYGAQHVSIGGERIIHTTVIREISGETKINGRTIRSLPLEILVVTDDFSKAEDFVNRMEISPIHDDLFLEQLQMNISKPEKEITVPAYEDPIRIKDIEAVEIVEGDS